MHACKGMGCGQVGVHVSLYGYLTHWSPHPIPGIHLHNTCMTIIATSTSYLMFILCFRVATLSLDSMRKNHSQCMHGSLTMWFIVMSVTTVRLSKSYIHLHGY